MGLPSRRISVTSKGIYAREVPFFREVVINIYLAADLCQQAYFFILPPSKSTDEILLGMLFVIDTKFSHEYDSSSEYIFGRIVLKGRIRV